MLVLMTLTLMQGHSGSAKAKNQRCMLSETKQAISIKLATTVDLFFKYILHDLDFANVYMASPTCFFWVFLPLFLLLLLSHSGHNHQAE